MIFPLLGFVLARVLVTGPQRFCRHDSFRVLLGTGVGIGLVSQCFFLSLLTGIPVDCMEVPLLLGLGAVAFLRSRAAECSFCTVASADRPWPRLLTATFLLAVVCVMGVFVQMSAHAPHGGWDAWAIHNLRARFLYRGGSNWRDVFSPNIGFAHPDYPMLLPAFIAREWKMVGTEITAIPAAVAFLFTFCTVGVLTYSVAVLCSRAQGFLAGLFLLGTPLFITQGASQLADVPLAFFLLATLALLALQEHWPETWGFAALAGTTGALACWTKNEGFLLVMAVVIAHACVMALRRERRSLRWLAAFGLGAAPSMAVVLYFKLVLAPQNYVLSQQSASPAHIFALWRYIKIGRAFAAQLWSFGGFSVGPLLLFLAVYLSLVKLRPREKRPMCVSAGAFAIVIAVAGYFMMYVATPEVLLDFLLYNSLDRLLLQLWPSTLFVAFLAARPTKASDSCPRMAAWKTRPRLP